MNFLTKFVGDDFHDRLIGNLCRKLRNNSTLVHAAYVPYTEVSRYLYRISDPIGTSSSEGLDDPLHYDRLMH